MKKILPLLFLAPAISAFANDGIAAVGVGGVVLGKTDDIAMKKEVLNVGWKKISVDYDFMNESTSDKEETIIFPLPEYDVYDADDLRYTGQPGNFSIIVDGQTVSYMPIVQAFFTTKDNKHVNITKELETIGLTKEQLIDSDPFPKIKDQKTKGQIASLLKRGYLANDSGDYRPNWSVQISYQWKQTFPAGRMIHVHHEYRPFSSAGPGFDEPEQIRDVNFCQDKSFTDTWEKKLKQGEEAGSRPGGSYVSYILQTGNTWKNGIEDFTLNLRKETPGELVTVCFPSDFKKIDSKTLQTHISNFHPATDLNVYFANIDLSHEKGEYKGIQPKIK
jgi:hypothetical protein